MTDKSLNPAATIIPADFWINRPIGWTTDGFPLYPTFAAPAAEEAPLEEVIIEEPSIGAPPEDYVAFGEFVELPSAEVGFERVRGERSTQGMRVVGAEWFDNEDLAT